jgi:hypothetical protein
VVVRPLNFPVRRRLGHASAIVDAIARVVSVMTRLLGGLALLAGTCFLGVGGWILLKGDTDWSRGPLVLGVLCLGIGVVALKSGRRSRELGGEVPQAPSNNRWRGP